MPLFDLQEYLGIDLDKWFLIQSTTQPYKRASTCHAFEKEWLECAHGLGQMRAMKECKIEMDDLFECINRHKMATDDHHSPEEEVDEGGEIHPARVPRRQARDRALNLCC
ncbi:NADH dehydrogenase [ubiquinone] iron-sulfur protein 5 isoform X1 [Hemicordylus capensis]|uniref:NADH dehydrogenase [ubiquinone] iron-sulfur protein 5 isoform X1 n=1 Tax=Hemicordylus capensis TaxID=884348 RepID=UPI00230376E9|nr:NADH dehydrogenase [ubiquinone] iron-sulfur protein 5 isoform X1 [Hemicordylus capensis]XP_053124836.1 NADH dehydrogenase [ubiquinone] iron-sulfur protein 5 isoform X1 [Hemicordylus capensis]